MKAYYERRKQQSEEPKVMDPIMARQKKIVDDIKSELFGSTQNTEMQVDTMEYSEIKPL